MSYNKTLLICYTSIDTISIKNENLSLKIEHPTQSKFIFHVPGRDKYRSKICISDCYLVSPTSKYLLLFETEK